MTDLGNVVDMNEYKRDRMDLDFRVLRALQEASPDWQTARQVRDRAAPLRSVNAIIEALDVMARRGAVDVQLATSGGSALYRYSETDL